MSTITTLEGASLKAHIKPENVLHGKLRQSASFSGNIFPTTESDYELYTGDYSVTPSIEHQVLETENKRMSGNIEVSSIPFYEVTNEKSGSTVVIGGLI